MYPEIFVVRTVSDAIRRRRWAVSATMSVGFSPLKFLIDDLYGGSICSTNQQIGDLLSMVCSEGVVYLNHLKPPLILVKKTGEPVEITQLARQLVRIVDQNGIEDLVLDHYRMLNFSKYVNPALALPMLQGIKTTPTVSLKRVHIFADPDTYHGKNHAWDWRNLLRRSLL
jgi:hypothetical protein